MVKSPVPRPREYTKCVCGTDINATELRTILEGNVSEAEKFGGKDCEKRRYEQRSSRAFRNALKELINGEVKGLIPEAETDKGPQGLLQEFVSFGVIGGKT